MAPSGAVPVERLSVSTLAVPTDGPESDGTLAWDRTTVVLVETDAGGSRGIGWTYADRAAAALVLEKLAGVVEGRDAMGIPAIVARMNERVRSDRRRGVAALAMAAVDASLWDLKAKLLGTSVVRLLGARRSSAPAYGSGGFTSYDDGRLTEQLAGWVEQGIPRVKMKVGREPARDVARVRVAREAIGGAALFVDANGAYTRRQALELAQAFHELGVVWFEEPVSSDDVYGLRALRDRMPPGMDVAAGEYGHDLHDFRRLLEAQAVDVVQVDATRCGIGGFMRADALCEAFGTPLSAHCAPTIHAHLACAAQRVVHVEYFHDHARVERMIFDGALSPRMGALWPDPSRPGLGVDLKRADVQRFAD